MFLWSILIFLWCSNTILIVYSLRMVINTSQSSVNFYLQSKPHPLNLASPTACMRNALKPMLYWSNPPVFSRFQPAKYLFNLPSKMSGLSINLPGQLIKRKAPLHILSSLLSIRQLLSLIANIFLIVGECVIGMLFDESI